MDFTVEKQTIRMKTKLKTEITEHAFDSELVLPDYCGDIARILKCKGEPKIQQNQIENGELTLEGVMHLSVLYVDDAGNVGCYQQNLPLYHKLSVGEEAESACITAKTDYCNCRVISPRKIEVHGAVSMRVVLHKNQEVALVTRVDGAGVERLETEESITTLVGYCQKNVTVNDEVQIASGSIRSVLRSSCVVTESECQTVSGKAVVKAQLGITAFYQTADGGFDLLRAQIPFSQMIDLDGADEHTDCFLHCTVHSLELRTRTGLDGECKNVLVTAGITMNLEATKTMPLSLVTDTYCTQNGLRVRRCAEPLVRLVQNVDEMYLCKQQVALEQDIASVLDVRCEESLEQVTVEGCELKVSGGLQLMVLAKDRDGGLLYFEKPLDYVWNHTLRNDADLVSNPHVMVENLAYTLTSDGCMELRAEMHISAQTYQSVVCNAMTDVTADPSDSPLAMAAPLVIYYAKAGERIFDIARQYNTSCQAVLSANGLEESILTYARALLIPAV